jgi:hypothetical protein
MHQEFDPRDLEPSLPARDDRQARSKVAPIMIALVALAGFGGVVWYAYDQGVRQAAPPGTTPLIKADSGPTKVRPDQPGGMDVPHQDAMVLNNLPDPNKAGAAPVERLLPPAETPLPRPTATAPAIAPQPGNPSLPPKIGPVPPPSAVAAVIPAPLQTPPTPPPPVQTAAAPPPPAAPVAPAAQPAPRPPAQTAAVVAPKPAPAPAGAGYRVRLVSVRAQDQTGQEWVRLQHAYPQLASLQMSVTRVDLGEKGIWFRIHAGPLNDAHAASQLCDAITAKDKSQGCLVEKP